MSESKPLTRINVVIRPSIKTLDEMSLKCPGHWTVKLLKSVIHEHSPSIKTIYAVDKLALVSRGRTCEDSDIVEDLWERVKI